MRGEKKSVMSGQEKKGKKFLLLATRNLHLPRQLGSYLE